MNGVKQNKNNWTKGQKKNYISYQAMNKIKLDQKHNLEQSVIKQNMNNSGKSAIDIFWSTECTKAQV